MKNLFITLIIGTLGCPYLFAQMSDTNTETINQYFQVTQNEEVRTNTTSSTINQNKMSYVDIVQTGIENSIYINALQSGDNQIVNQTGSQNNYEYYNYYGKENSNLNVNQEGTLNSLQVFGENSLMKDAVINQKSNFKSVVIKNYTN